jgi:hypothetical protein
MERWKGMKMEEIRDIEDKKKEEIDKKSMVGEVRGMKEEKE